MTNYKQITYRIITEFIESYPAIRDAIMWTALLILLIIQIQLFSELIANTSLELTTQQETVFGNAYTFVGFSVLGGLAFGFVYYGYKSGIVQWVLSRTK